MLKDVFDNYRTMFLKITERCCWRFQNDGVETSSPGSMSLRATTDMMQPKRGCSNSLKEQYWWETCILLLSLTGRLRSSLQSHDKPCDQESLCTATSASYPVGCPGPPTWKSKTCPQSSCPWNPPLVQGQAEVWPLLIAPSHLVSCPTTSCISPPR